MRILMVEDEFTSRNLLLEMLKPYGSVAVAISGEEALEALNMAWSKRQPYDLICLDLSLPSVNGDEVLRQIRLTEKMRGLEAATVLITTAHKEKEIVVQCMREGCSGYLLKPFNKEQIDAVIKKYNLMR